MVDGGGADTKMANSWEATRYTDDQIADAVKSLYQDLMTQDKQPSADKCKTAANKLSSLVRNSDDYASQMRERNEDLEKKAKACQGMVTMDAFTEYFSGIMMEVNRLKGEEGVRDAIGKVGRALGRSFMSPNKRK